MSLSKARASSLVVLGFFYARSANAINCTVSSFSWASNSLGQNPCTIVEQLEGACYNEVYILDPLTPGTNYVTPQKNADPSCECNTVMYSLYQACTLCQNATQEDWGFYDQYCSTVYISTYPVDIPHGTTIPHWAYLNVTDTNNLFNAASASAAAKLPESTPPTPSTASNSQSSTSSSVNSMSTKTPDTATSSGGSTSPSATASKKSNTGAIAGGVVGGVVVLALIGAAIAYLLHRRRIANQQAEVAQNAPYSAGLLHSPTLAQNFRPYDPSDPSTFPASIGEHSAHGDSMQGSGSGYPQTTIPARGGYSGVAEI